MNRRLLRPRALILRVNSLLDSDMAGRVAAFLIAFSALAFDCEAAIAALVTDNIACQPTVLRVRTKNSFHFHLV